MCAGTMNLREGRRVSSGRMQAGREQMTRSSWSVAVLGTTILLLAACGIRSQIPEGADLIPGDATFAVSVDVPAIFESALYKKYQSQESVFGRNRLNFYRFAQAAGIDPIKDVRRVLFMARAEEQGLQEMSALVTGTFDGRKVHDFLADQGMPSRKQADVDIFEFVVIDGRCRFCLAVIDQTTAAFGDGETLRKMIEVRQGTVPGMSASAGAARLLARVGQDKEAWGIVRAADLKGALAGVLKQFSTDSGALAGLGPIQEVAFSLDTAEPMRVLVEVTAQSDKDAMLVADVLKGAEALGRLTLKEARPELARLMSDLVIEADTGIVRVAGSIPTSDVETVARALGLTWLSGRLEPSGSETAEPSPSEPETSR